MTVSSTTNRITYNCKGSQKEFPFTFKILEEENLVVILKDPNNAETILVLNTDYSVSEEPWETGGSITTLDEDAYASGYTLTIIRQLDLVQGADYLEGDSFPAETHEEQLDRLMMIAQQLLENLNRTLFLKITSAFKDLTLPNPVAGQYLRWKPDSSGLENIESGDFGDAPNCYTKTMTGNETFVYSGGNHIRCFLDPGGANRNFDPLESFPSGFKSEIINTGGEIITFDSAVSAQNVGPGQRGVFLFNNSVWY